MSANRLPEPLARALARGTSGYLVSLARSGRAHVGVVSVGQDGDRIVLTEVGAGTCGNLAVDRRATVVLPPLDAGGYTLIVDGHAVPDGARYLIAPARAVLHRHGQPGAEPADGGCVADCVELAVSGLPLS